MSHLAPALVLVLSLAAPFALGDGANENGKLTGPDLKLLWKDHHLTGTVGKSDVTAVPLSGEFGVKMTHRTGGQTFTSVLRRTSGAFRGTVKGLNTKGNPAEVQVVISKVDAKQGTLEGTLNGTAFSMKVSASQMNGHHFVSPQFEARMGNETYRFEMKEGEACMGCAVRITYTVLSLVTLNGLW